MKFKWLVLIALLLPSHHALAECVGQSPSWTASDCTDATIIQCIDLAESGDTIEVPAGECTWESAVTIPKGKTIKLIGSGSDQTIIRSNTRFMNVYADDSRISGFGFHRSADGDNSTLVQVRGIGFRIDHNYMYNAAYESQWAFCVFATAANETVRPEGVVDSNYFDKCKVGASGSTILEKDNGFWADPSVIGTPRSVYFEDNTIDRGNIGSVISDSNYAGSFVFRYNALIGGNAMTHSLQGRAHRATKSWEYYRNNWTLPTTLFYDIAFLRGGTGMFFDNTVTGPRESYQISLDNVRSFRTGCCGNNPPPATDDAGMCDGTSPWDGNIEANGWPCRDQIGRGPDTAPDDSVIGRANSSAPAYFWNNRQTGVGPVPVVVRNGSDAWILADRECYNEVGGFDGTTGIGMGNLEQRPASCTPGTGYWAADQGNWNQLDDGRQGVLYTCSDAGTWELAYTPYTYPHPLREASEDPGIFTQPNLENPNAQESPSTMEASSGNSGGGSSGCFVDSLHR